MSEAGRTRLGHTVPTLAKGEPGVKSHLRRRENTCTQGGVTLRAGGRGAILKLLAFNDAMRNALLQIAPDSGQLQSLDIAKGVSKWAIANV